MTLYNLYLQYIKKHSEECLSRDLIFKKPYQLLRELETKSWMRTHGTFFTDDAVASCLFNNLQDFDRIVYDPAAGCGDLLLRYLECGRFSGDFHELLQIISHKIIACEINQSFVALTRLRFWLYAYWRTHGSVSLGKICIPSTSEVAKCFPDIVVGDGLRYMPKRLPDMILMNPPFQCVRTQGQYQWASGQVSLAAIFLDEIRKRFMNSRIMAVLPDVIRAGTRYQKLRNHIGFNGASCTIYGRFDEKTDVDVFTLDLGWSGFRKHSVSKIDLSHEDLSKYFEIHVGSVVQYRDMQEGKRLGFLCADTIAVGAKVGSVTRMIASQHRPVKGPFVVLRRTSSPSDRKRCASSVITSSSEFHVDNHLVWLRPHCSGYHTSLRMCFALHNYFQSQECTDLVNRLIRCRHLTVRIISQLPFGGKINV